MVRLGESHGTPVGIDVEMLLRQRLLVTASSGGGKTKLITKLCEVCAANIQIIIIDPEGEFAALRANYPFVLASKDGETPATVASAGMLATRLLELRASAICDIYELPPMQRHEFVRNFLTAMIDSPKSLWHPVLVIVDEETINMLKEQLTALADTAAQLEEQNARYAEVMDTARGHIDALATLFHFKMHALKPVEKIALPIQKTRTSSSQPKIVRSSGPSDSSLPTGERQVLTVLAQYPDGLQRETIGIYSGYVKRSTRDAYLQRLQAKGYVEQNGIELRITNAGIGAVGDYDPLPSGEDLLQYWLAKLPKGEAEMLLTLSLSRRGLTREQLGEKTGYTARSTRDAYIQRLTQKRLISTSGSFIVASEILFD